MYDVYIKSKGQHFRKYLLAGGQLNEKIDSALSSVTQPGGSITATHQLTHLRIGSAILATANVALGCITAGCYFVVVPLCVIFCVLMLH